MKGWIAEKVDMYKFESKSGEIVLAKICFFSDTEVFESWARRWSGKETGRRREDDSLASTAVQTICEN